MGSGILKKATVLLILCGAVFAPSLHAQKPSGKADARTQTILKGGWQYLLTHWSDPALKGDRTARAKFLAGLGEGAWRDLPAGRNSLKTDALNQAWFRVRLPDRKYPDAVLHIPLVNQSFQVFLEDGTLLYEFGEPEKGKAGFAGWPAHMIPLGETYPGSLLYFRVYSDYQRIGVAGEPVVGARANIWRGIIRGDIDRFILGCLFLFTGLLVLFVYARSPGRTINLAFALFALDMGLYVISNRTLRMQHLLLDAPLFWFYTEYITLYLLPAILGYFFEHIIPGSRTVRWTWRILLFIGLLFILLHFTFVPFYATLFDFFRVTLAAAIISLVFLARAAWQGNREARMAAAGTILFTTTATYDLLGVLGHVPWPRQFLPWGLFLYFLVLGFIVAARVRDIHQSLKIHSADLEKARDRLRDHAENLEDKVRLRTAELQESLDQTRALKEQQDGDYYLTSLLMQPLRGQDLRMEMIHIDMLVSQKKKFEFKNRRAEIGGDLCLAREIHLNGESWAVFLNGDAMGKSLQGAGGAIVLGVAFQTIVDRTHETGDLSPEAWLETCWRELHKTFLSFNGSMLVSVVLGLVREATGELIYVNTEHPEPVLIREGKAKFPEDTAGMRKLGTSDTEPEFVFNRLRLEKGDTVIIGSDGRDDLITGRGEGGDNVYNADENQFLSVLGEGTPSLEEIARRIRETGEITDDLSLLRIQYGD